MCGSFLKKPVQQIEEIVEEEAEVVPEPILEESSPTLGSAGSEGKQEGVKRTGLNDQSLAQANRKGAGRYKTALNLNIPQPSSSSLRI